MSKARTKKRQAYHHRVWRLACLLTEDGREARELFAAVLDDRPRPERLEPVQLDRLTVLRGRELAERWAQRRVRWWQGAGGPEVEGGIDLDARARFVHTEAHNLPRQLMEAWMLRRVDGLSELATSRAMDCSRTALAVHLEGADQELGEQLGEDLQEAAARLRRAVDGLDPAPAVIHWTRRRRRRRVLRWSILLLLFLGLLLAVYLLRPWS